jgi:hypothetical protein
MVGHATVWFNLFGNINVKQTCLGAQTRAQCSEVRSHFRQGTSYENATYEIENHRHIATA